MSKVSLRKDLGKAQGFVRQQKPVAINPPTRQVNQSSRVAKEVTSRKVTIPNLTKGAKMQQPIQVKRLRERT